MYFCRISAERSSIRLLAHDLRAALTALRLAPIAAAVKHVEQRVAIA